MISGSGKGRNACVAQAINAVEWANSRTRSFHWSQLAEVLELGRRSTYRWIEALESNGVVERVGGMSGMYRPTRLPNG